MAIIDIDDIEAAYGDISDADEDRVEYFIDVVSAYIEDVTGLSFEEEVDVPEVCLADKYGVIDFAFPITISTVEEYNSGTDSFTAVPFPGYTFNGIDCIYNLCPYGTYRLTISYGYSDAPATIKGVATALVAAAAGIDPAATDGLVSVRVGDREEAYGVSSNGSVSITSIQEAAFLKYVKTAWTERT